MDRYPSLPGLLCTLGKSVYVCPDCDGYEIQNRKTVVLGAGNTGANMALLLSERTHDMTYINHEKKEISSENQRLMLSKGIVYIEAPIKEIEERDDGIITGIVLEQGPIVSAERGFIAFGGNDIHSELANQLGVNLHDNKHAYADPRTRLTNVNRVWIAGDLGVHAEQVTVAMGDGAIAAISIHKVLREEGGLRS